MKTIIVSILVILIMIGYTANAHSGYFKHKQSSQQESHLGLYFSGSLGLKAPTGPDWGSDYSKGFGWRIGIGYQFIKNLAIEIGYDEGIGRISGYTDGIWIFKELPYLNLKPVIPLSSFSNLYFITGIGYGNAFGVISDQDYGFSFVLSPNIAFNIGVGYERHINKHWSLGGDIIYHNLASHYRDGSITSANFVFRYHF